MFGLVPDVIAFMNICLLYALAPFLSSQHPCYFPDNILHAERTRKMLLAIWSEIELCVELAENCQYFTGKDDSIANQHVYMQIVYWGKR